MEMGDLFPHAEVYKSLVVKQLIEAKAAILRFMETI